MEKKKFNSILQEISNRKELYELESICNKFNITMKSIYKIKNKYKVIDYSDNIYCLKKSKKGKRKIINSYKLTRELYNRGFINVPFYIPT